MHFRKIFKKEIYNNTMTRESSYFTFAIGGILVFLYEIIVTILITEIWDVWYMFSYALALCSGLFISFYYHSRVTFCHCLDAKTKIMGFGINYIFVFLIAWITVLLATKLGLHYIISIVLISLLCSLLNYYFNKKLVFEEY